MTLALFLLALACGGPRVAGHEPWMKAQGAGHKHSARSEPVDVLEGLATYYSDSLAGNHTASGEIYDPRALTAASRDLPFGTVVRVVRVKNGRSVTVRINDRGPWGDRNRILDLSRAAAEELDMIHDGVVKVRAEILKYGPRKK